MNKIIKCLCGLMLALVCCMIPATKADAATAGNFVENAMEITLGEEHTIEWTADNCEQGKVYKIVVPEDGWLNVWLSCTKVNGEVRAPMAAQLYNSEKMLILDHSNNDTFFSRFQLMGDASNFFEIGLEKGTYYIKVEYDRIYERRLSDTETAYAQLLVGYTEDSACETEDNNSKEAADELKVNMLYRANYDNRCEDVDWFKVKLEKGETYRIRGEIYSFITPDGIDIVNSLKEVESKTGESELEYTPTVSGIYYIEKQQICKEIYSGKWYITYEIGVLTSDRTPTNAERNGLIKASDGNVYYYKDGKTMWEYTGLVQQDGKQWYVKEGRVSYETALVRVYNGDTKETGLYYIENGVLSNKETLVLYDGKWLHIKNGTTTDFTGFITYKGNEWYVKNGEVKFITGLILHQNRWWYIRNGVLNETTTLVNCYGAWWYITDGAVSFETTMVPFAGKQWYVKGGAVSFVTDFVYCEGKWWLVQNGAVSNITSLVPYKGKWWYVKDGAVSFENTLVPYGGKTWLVLNGTVHFATTMVPYEGKWWYIKDGAVSQETTLVQYNGQWWYVKDGTVDFSFNGEVPYNGKNWTVKNGSVVF